MVAVLSVEVAAVPAGSTGAQVGDVIDVQIPEALVEAGRRALPLRQAYVLPHCQHPEPRVQCMGPSHDPWHRCAYCKFLAPQSAGSKAENAAKAKAELQTDCLTAIDIKGMSRKALERHLATYPADAMSPIGRLSQYGKPHLRQQLLRRISPEKGDKISLEGLVLCNISHNKLRGRKGAQRELPKAQTHGWKQHLQKKLFL